MAKEEKKVSEITAENIEAVLKQDATVTKEIADEAAKKIAEKRKEELTNRLIDCVNKSAYIRKRTCINMRHANEIAKISVNYTKQITELDNKLNSGEISIDDFNKEIAEKKKTADKLIGESDTKKKEQIDALIEQYPNASWEWNWRNLTLERQ